MKIMSREKIHATKVPHKNIKNFSKRNSEFCKLLF